MHTGWDRWHEDPEGPSCVSGAPAWKAMDGFEGSKCRVRPEQGLGMPRVVHTWSCILLSQLVTLTSVDVEMGRVET